MKTPLTPSPVLPFALFLFLSFGAGDAAAAKLLVATHGTDSAACGTSGAPCRSISQAIANAEAGDTIVVGPGRYGDANADGSFDDPGDEPAQIDTGCDCLVHVPADKPLFLFSRDGATATLIDAGGAPIRVVKVDAPGTTFGKPKRGFTLKRSGDTIGFDSSADDLHVAGNIALANPSHGFRVQGDRCDVNGNQALHNGGSGFFLDGARDGVTRSNLAVGNEDDGFAQVNPSLVQKNVSIGNLGDGFDQQGDDVVYRGNAALANGGFGFDLNSGDRTLLTGNLANSNRNGARVGGSDTVLTRNSIVGNLGVGVVVEAGGTPLTIAASNLFGNNAEQDPVVTNCGVTLLATGPLNLATNFWGAAAGPGADPADALCPLVPQTGLVSDPPALEEIRIKPPG